MIKVLERLLTGRERMPPEYLYYGIPSPWLQARCLRCLQHFPPPDSSSDRKLLNELLTGIINASEWVRRAHARMLLCTCCMETPSALWTR